MKKLHNRKYLKEVRRELRNCSTKSESMLWKALKNKKLSGRKFRMQHSIENFVVDFYCPTENLIVELDGHVHFNLVNSEYDNLRTKRLKLHGFKVLRFENRLVFEQLDMVLGAIEEAFED